LEEMKELASNELSKVRKEHQGEIEKLKSDYESMKMNYENKIVQNVEQVKKQFTFKAIFEWFGHFLEGFEVSKFGGGKARKDLKKLNCVI